MHIPTCESSLLDIVGFDEALAASGGRGDYDADKWLYVPDYYTDYRYILGTRGKDPLICIGINPLPRPTILTIRSRAYRASQPVTATTAG